MWKVPRELIDCRHNFVAAGHGECPTRAEIDLRIDDDQHIALNCRCVDAAHSRATENWHHTRTGTF
jgi:hypothetical protein